MYKSITTGYEPRAEKMAEIIEAEANRMDKEGYNLVSFSIMPSAKAVLVFKEKEVK